MSFSSEVKDELVKQMTEARHCQIAELAAILTFTAAVKYNEQGSTFLTIQEETSYAARRCFALLEKAFHIELKIEESQIQALHHFEFNRSDEVDKILQTIKYTKEDKVVNSLVMKNLCCKRAFLRGAFLSIGSISNPQKGYHLEFVCDNIEQARQIQETLALFHMEAKTVQRKRYQILYMKESEGIVELLNVMGAHISLMNLENLRIWKDMRNSVNRRVNCEAANITKTVNASTKQIEDIQYIKEHYGFQKLSDNLREMAQVRLDYPDATLKELGEYLTPQVGKSGVNHRLRKLGELADQLRRS